MQPGYTSDDFVQPGFCQVCGTHVPKSVLIANGGRCNNCLRAGMPSPQWAAIPVPSSPHLSASPGCIAGVLFVAAVVLFGGGMMVFLKAPKAHEPSKTVQIDPSLPAIAPPKFDPSPSPDTGLSDSLDIPGADQLRAAAVVQVETAFQITDISPDSVALRSVTDRTNADMRGADVIAEGNFDANVAGNRSNVRWRIGFVHETGDRYRMVFREASIPTIHGSEEYDWDNHAFISLDRSTP